MGASLLALAKSIYYDLQSIFLYGLCAMDSFNSTC